MLSMVHTTEGSRGKIVQVNCFALAKKVRDLYLISQWLDRS